MGRKESSRADGYGYERAAAPEWLDLCTRLAGFMPVRAAGGAFRYLQLGSDQGLGLCLLAAANPSGQFVGVVSAPFQIAHGQALARSAGLDNIRFIEAHLDELAGHAGADLGTFDYVVMQDASRACGGEDQSSVRAILERVTHIGSVVYAGYRAQPGAQSAEPLRRLTHLLGEGGALPPDGALDAALRIFDGLKVAEARIFEALPGLESELDKAKGVATAEPLGEPVWHSQVAQALAKAGLAKAGLAFVGTATLPETQILSMLPDALRELVSAQSRPSLRQDLQDIAINQSYRRDIFCRGLAPSFGLDREVATATRLTLLTPPEEGAVLHVPTVCGSIALGPQLYTEIVETLDRGSATVAELAELPGIASVSQAIRLAILLIEAGTVGLLSPAPGDARAAERLNAAIARAAVRGAPYGHLACAALGSAVSVSETDLILLDSWFAVPDRGDARTLAGCIADRLARVGRTIQQGPRTLAEEEAIQRLMPVAQGFIDTDYPRWRNLGALV